MKHKQFLPQLNRLLGRFMLAGLFTVIALNLFAQEKAPYYVKSFESSVTAVEAITAGGSIQVIHEPGQNNRIEVYIKGNNGNDLSKSEIEERLKEKYELLIETSANRVKAIARNKKGFNDWKNSLSISFKIYGPAKLDTDLKTSGGSIKLKGLTGNQDFATSGGSLHVEGIKGNIDGATSGGSINLSGSEGNIELATSGGSITATNCKGQIDLATSGGSLKLENLEGTIEAKTSGGSVSGGNIKGELKTGTSGGSIRLSGLTCSIDAATSGGSMDIAITALGNYVKLHNSAGSINVTLPAGKGMNLDLEGNRVSVPGLTNFSGSASEDEIKGKINGGGVPVTVRASSGKVNLSFGGK